MEQRTAAGPVRSSAPTAEPVDRSGTPTAPPSRPPTPRPARSSVRRELLLSLLAVFAGAMLLASVPLLLGGPLLQEPGTALLFVVLLVAADLGVVFLFARSLVNRLILRPVDRIVDSAERIAAGDFDHRIPGQGTREFERLAESVNAMARSLIHNQRLLEQNIHSLDRTNRELVEATGQLLRSARMASVGTLAAGVAHEVGNPLGAVVGYLDVARRKAERGEAVDDMIGAAREEALRIDRIVRSLLDFARPRRDLDEGPVDPSKLVERVHSLLETQGKLAGIRTEWQVEEGLAPLSVDPQFVEQILVNLLLNAVDAVEGVPGPWIGVSLSRERVRGQALPWRREGDPPGVNFAHRRRWEQVQAGTPGPAETRGEMLVLQVGDNGPGLPGGRSTHIFDPFFTTKEPGRGTGLGLAISARLAAELGGEIEAADRPEGGALFKVRIPSGGREGS